MPKSPVFRQLKRRLKVIADALPPFPRPPSWRQIASWWHDQRHHGFLPPLPRFPSRHRIAAWWRERRHQRILPPLPRVPTTEEVIRGFRERASEVYGVYGEAVAEAPTPRNIREWIQEKPVRKKYLIWWVVTLLLLAGIASQVPRGTRAIKGWQAKRQAGQAMALIDQQNWPEASRRVRSAFQLRSTEPEVWRAYARLLSRIGQGAMALQWWQKVAQTKPLTLEDQRDFASAALTGSELSVAAEQVAHLLAQPNGPASADLFLAAQLATVRGYTATAIDFADRVLSDARSTSSEKLGANLVILSNSTPDLQRYKDAAARLVEIARNESDPASPQALTVLGRQARRGRLTANNAESSLAIETPEVTTTSMSLTDIADRLERNPNSHPYHRMLAMELRAKVNPDRESELVEKAVQSYGQGDDETLLALGAWLYTRHRFEAMLKIIPLERAEQRRDLLTEYIDALAALNRYAELEELLLREHAVLDSAFQHMYLAEVREKLGEIASPANEWLRALDAAESPRSLLGLADYAEKKGALDIADEAYARLLKRQPELKSGYLSRLRVAQLRGATTHAHDIALEILRFWPEDDATRMREIYLRLLVTNSPDEVKAAEEQAAPFLAKNPWDGVARSAVALAQLKQGKSAAALTTMTEFSSEVPASAISLPVHAAVLAANGWKDKARELAKSLATENILPEERQLLPR